MFKKVLFPTDYSDASKKAVEYVKKLKEAGTEEVIILHVLDDGEMHSLKYYSASNPDIHDKVLKINNQRAKEELAVIADELRKIGLTVRVMIVEGIPFQEILRVEEEEDVSMVVMGSHGKSAIEGVFLGSVSTKVIRRSTRPVLVIRWKED
jgi:nucleotide-binding universal stress UspA family protein